MAKTASWAETIGHRQGAARHASRHDEMTTVSTTKLAYSTGLFGAKLHNGNFDYGAIITSIRGYAEREMMKHSYYFADLVVAAPRNAGQGSRLPR